MCSQVLEQEIVVKPGDSDVVRLSIVPLKPGLLRITGLEWVLNGQAQGRRLFAAKAARHRRTGSRYSTREMYVQSCCCNRRCILLCLWIDFMTVVAQDHHTSTLEILRHVLQALTP